MFRSLSIHRFRGFRRLHIEPLTQFNLFIGKNNVGKTAVLEACFLLVGPTNPELPLRINVFRGIEQYRSDPEEIWGWIFYKKDISEPILLEAQSEKKRDRKLQLRLAQPRVLPMRNGKKTRAIGQSSATLTTAIAPSELTLRYTDEVGKRHDTKAFLRESSIGVDRGSFVKFANSIYIGAKVGYTHENPERYSKLEEVGTEKEILPALQILEPRLKKVAVIVTGNGPLLHGDIGMGRMVPLPFMGEGMGRMATLILAMANCPEGVLMIDEIETGLHYSVMTNVWKSLAEAAKRFNVQVFTTTHSWECLKSSHEAFSEIGQYDLSVHRLDRDKDEVTHVAYDRHMIETALKSGVEIR